MSQFKDARGRDWKIEITIGTRADLKDACGVDIFEMGAGKPPLAQRLISEIDLLVDMIYVVAQPVTGEKITDVEFAHALDGRSWNDARTTFLEALVSFFRQCGREDLALAVEKAGAILDIAVATAEGRIREIDPQTVMSKALSEIASSDKSGEQPESSELILES